LPLLIQICIAVATLAVVGIAIALIRVLGQVQKTAAQVERTMTTLDESIPTIVRTVEEARGAIDSLHLILGRADHIASDFETIGGKAARLSNLVVDQLLTPATQAAAIVTGVRTGATFLLDGWLKRRKAGALSTGGNHNE